MRLFLSLLAIALVVGYCSAGRLEDIIKNRYSPQQAAEKRDVEGTNPCPPDEPFPCKTPKCIPMLWVCDDNWDCEDGYDEDPALCTAARRPPVEKIKSFIEDEKDWIIPGLFPGKSIKDIAHGLAVSQNIDEFRHRVGLTRGETKNLKEAFNAVKLNEEGELIDMYNMPPTSWGAVKYVFSKLIKTKFLD